MKHHVSLLLFFTVLLTVSSFSLKKEEDATDSTTVLVEQLRSEIQQLRLTLDSLRNANSTSLSLSVDDLEQMEERIEQRIRELEKKVDAISRSTTPTILNPRTTAFINVAARADNKDFMDEFGQNYITNSFYLRSAELDFRAPVDPYAEAIMILSVENDAGGGFEIDAEEAYGLLKRLPLLESAPLGVKVKIGKFRPALGMNNKIHMHDLPWTTRPLVISKYLGTEHGEFFEGGFSATGVDLDFFLPSIIPSTTIEMNLDIVQQGELGLSNSLSKKNPAFVGHLSLSQDWNNEHLLILGVSGYREGGDYYTRLYGADITYKWSPVEHRQSNSFVIGGEIHRGEFFPFDRVLNISSFVSKKASGWFVYSQYQFSYWTYVGVRYDWVEEPYYLEDGITRSISSYVSYYTTEFLRFRLGYQNLTSQSSFYPQDINSVQFEVNFVFGSHPTEPYWVNR